MLNVGTVHGVGVTFTRDLDHEFEVTFGHKKFEATLVLNQVLENGAGVQSLLNVSCVLL